VVLSIALGLLLAALGAAALGASVGEFFATLLSGTLGSAYGVSQVFFKATPLLFAGLAAAVAFQARLFNIGAEGQMVIGGFAMAWVGFAGPPLPAPLGVIACLAAGALAGALWGGIAGAIKGRSGGSEVIATIMLNFIAQALAGYLLIRFFALPETVRTAEIHPGAWLPRFSDSWPALAGSPLNGGLVVGVLLAVALFVLLRDTPFGYAVRVLGSGLRQARYGGLAIGRLSLYTMALSGAIAGMAGASFILGYKRYYEDGFSAGDGFRGIAVALLARNRPLAVIPSSLFFGLLSYGGLVVNRIVPRELLEVVQAAILLLFIVLDRWMGRLFARRWESSGEPPGPLPALTDEPTGPQSAGASVSTSPQSAGTVKPAGSPSARTGRLGEWTQAPAGDGLATRRSRSPEGGRA